MCVSGLIGLLRDGVKTYSVLLEKVTLQLCQRHGIKRSLRHGGIVVEGYIKEYEIWQSVILFKSF